MRDRDSSNHWQKILAEGFSSAAELLHFLNLPISLANADAEKIFKTRVPRGFALKMKPGDINDPLLRQVLAVDEEMNEQKGFAKDPLQEASKNSLPGMIHKYAGRVLLTLTGTCAIQCRYCFRRHFPYDKNNPGRQGWSEALDYIAKDASLHEVILSGGDPLMATDSSIDLMLTALEQIPHVKTVRFHTRVPIVLAERVNHTFLQRLKQSPLHKVMVLHVNHPQELDSQIAAVCASLRESGCHLLNQSVLLAGVNDDINTLTTLSERLFQYQVLPYYLHILDKVEGSAHFEVTLDKALDLFHQLQQRLPGYLVPRLACEEPGKTQKTLLI